MVRAHPEENWPPLPLQAWQPTCTTLHRWTQIVGKVRLALAPPSNHWWHVPLYVSARGLTTGLIAHPGGGLQIDFDFFDHILITTTGDGRQRRFTLPGRSVAGFYREFMATLAALGLRVKLWPVPVEVADSVPFPQDSRSAYDAAAVQRFWRALVQSQRVLEGFRGRFLGKASPVQFFWGSFDLAVSRFSGQGAPPHPAVPGLNPRVVAEAYSHQVSSAGFWPGGGGFEEPAFYSYAYPEPEGFRDYPIRPRPAFFSRELGEFILPYEAVRSAGHPDELLLEFLQSSYQAAAELGGWDRRALERPSLL